MPTIEEIIQQVQAYMASGERQQAEDLLVRMLVQEPKNTAYWMLLSQVVAGVEERVDCLQQIMRLDPNHAEARQALESMGIEPAQPATVIRDPLEAPKKSRKITRQKLLFLAGGLGALFLIILMVSKLFDGLPGGSGRLEGISYQPLPTATQVPTVQPTATRLPPGPTPPWAVLPQAYTPTPVYGRTPHPVLEAYQMAVAAFEKQDYSSAARYFKQSAEGDPSSADAAYWLGESHRMQGDWQQARLAYDQAVARSPGFAPGLLGRARVMMQLDKPDLIAAEQDLQAALLADDQLGEAYIELANVYLRSGRPVEAFAPLEQADRLLQGTPLTLLARAEAHRQMDQLEVALDEIERAISTDLALLPAYRLKGGLLHALERDADAIVPLEIYLRYHPAADSEALAWLGGSYLGVDRPEDALTMLERAAQQPEYPTNTYALMGEAYLDLELVPEALQAFTRAVEDDPESFAAAMGLAESQMLAGDPRLAAYTYGRLAMRTIEPDLRAKALYGQAQAVMAYDPEEAAKIWQVLIELPAGSVEEEQLAAAEEALASLTP